MTDVPYERVNALTRNLVQRAGRELFKLDDPVVQMVCVEDLTASLVVLIARVHDEDVGKLLEVLLDHLPERVTSITNKMTRQSYEDDR